jgi:hypothetical protein
VRFLAIITAIAVVAAIGAPAQTKSSATKKSSSKAASKSKAAKSTAKSTARVGSSKVATKGKSATGKSSASKGRRTPIGPRRPPAQQQPTPDRFREIQQALADKGYFKGPVDGNWGPESTEALKRFQQEQNLDPDGKLSALSLIALGLGPRHGTASAEAAKPPDAAATSIPVDPPPVAEPQP